MNRFKLYLMIIVLYNVVYADEIKVGTSFLKMNYVETGKNGEFLDSELSSYSNIDGYNITYQKDIGKLDEDNSLESISISFRDMKGSSLYNGFLQQNGVIIAPYQSVTQNEILEAKIRFKKTKYSLDYDYTYFVSFAKREWTRDMSGSPYGYLEFYEWKYYDLGFKTIFYDGHWELGLEVAYQKAISPSMIAYMNIVSKFDLGTTQGYYYKIPLGYNINKNMKIELEYEFNKWSIGASNIVNGYYEPDSDTKNEIVSLNLVYKF